MAAAFLVGRILLGGFYIFSAFEQFSGLSHLARLAGARGVPFPQLAVAVAGVLLLIGGLSLLLGLMPRVGVAALALFFIPVTLVMHAFWADHDPAIRMMNVVNFGKNLALFASALMFLAIPEPWPYSVQARRGLRVRQPA
jgi:uncharacterized membrane protein YphA (DoxX/SURF4 family)